VLVASPGRCSRSAIAAAQTAQIGRSVILRFGVGAPGSFFWPNYEWMIGCVELEGHPGSGSLGLLRASVMTRRSASMNERAVS
jgi:hypothetical protein